MFYFNNGKQVYLTKNSTFQKGQIFYSQDISSDERWIDTLSRNDLKVIQVSEISTNTNEVYFDVFETKDKELIKIKTTTLEEIMSY